MVVLGAIFFGILFLILAIILLYKCVTQIKAGDSKMLSLAVCLCYIWCIVSMGSLLSYWLWNAGLERTSKGEVQSIILNGSDREQSVIHVRHQTDWAPKVEFLFAHAADKYVFQTGEKKLDMSCSDNKDDEAIPVVCVKWAADISSKEKMEELLDSFPGNKFSKSELEKIITETSEESHFECTTHKKESDIDGCIADFMKNFDLPNIHIVDVIKV